MIFASAREFRPTKAWFTSAIPNRSGMSGSISSCSGWRRLRGHLLVVRLESFLPGTAVATDLGRLRRQQGPHDFMVLFEDSAALLGILIAAIATFLSSTLDCRGSTELVRSDRPRPRSRRGAAGARKQGIADRRARIPGAQRGGTQTASEDPCVRNVVDITTSQMGPDQVIATISIEIDEDLRVPQVEQLIARIEESIRSPFFPQLFRILSGPSRRVHRSRSGPGEDAGRLAAVPIPEQKPATGVLSLRKSASRGRTDVTTTGE